MAAPPPPLAPRPPPGNALSARLRLVPLVPWLPASNAPRRFVATSRGQHAAAPVPGAMLGRVSRPDSTATTAPRTTVTAFDQSGWPCSPSRGLAVSQLSTRAKNAVENVGDRRLRRPHSRLNIRHLGHNLSPPCAIMSAAVLPSAGPTRSAYGGIVRPTCRRHPANYPDDGPNGDATNPHHAAHPIGQQRHPRLGYPVFQAGRQSHSARHSLLRLAMPYAARDKQATRTLASGHTTASRLQSPIRRLR
jgi:hypothetical protein